MYVLGRCRRFDAWSPQTLQAAAEKFRLSKRDMALCTRLCRCVLQNSAYCDFLIGRYCTQNVKRLEPQVLDILRLGVCQLLFMDKIPVSAAVSESVELCRAAAPKAAGLVNAVLRRVAENRESLPEPEGIGTPAYLAVRYSHPLWLCERMTELLGYDECGSWLRENNTEPPLTLTRNPLKGESGADSVPESTGGRVQELPGYAEGKFFVQDAAAAEAVRAAEPKPGMRVLDGCAAPGGKSFLAAMLMENDGEIISCDLHEKKLALIDEGAERLGISILRTLPMDGSRPYDSFRGSFDLVISDVPCSGLGVIRRKPEIRYKTQEELSRLPEIQLGILRGLAACVRSGGTLLYSTCTLLPEENDGVVAAFLAGNKDFTMKTERTLWPQRDGTDGFYYCVLKKA